VAIGSVRAALTTRFGTRIQLTPIAYQGTLIEADATVDASEFAQAARRAIAAAEDSIDPQSVTGC
jgi:hypothetical protein